jgi:sulfide dehydrogenase cytochrome subunit
MRFLIVHFLVLVTAVAFVAPSLLGAENVGNASRGAALAHACAPCHGSEGVSQGAIPSIRTMPRENLIEALRAFRAETRPGTVMNRIAKGLDDADIEAVAAYFASLQNAK